MLCHPQIVWAEPRSFSCWSQIVAADHASETGKHVCQMPGFSTNSLVKVFNARVYRTSGLLEQTTGLWFLHVLSSPIPGIVCSLASLKRTKALHHPLCTMNRILSNYFPITLICAIWLTFPCSQYFHLSCQRKNRTAWRTRVNDDGDLRIAAEISFYNGLIMSFISELTVDMYALGIL